VSDTLRYRHIDTGAMYRAIGWKAIQEGLDLDNEELVSSLAQRADIRVDNGLVSIDGADITRAIRTPEIDRAATRVARLPRVRQVLVDRQRAFAAAGGVVMEGRDIGTVVCRDADVKIYLDASAEERARRRANDPAHTSGGSTSQAVVAEAIAARDRADSTRAASPLMVADEAVVIDTTTLTIDEVVQRVMAVVQQAIERRA
jgi:cytidylate kinase